MNFYNSIKLLSADEADLGSQIHNDVTEIVKGVKDNGLGWIVRRIADSIAPAIPSIVMALGYLVLALLFWFIFMKLVRRWVKRSKLEKGVHNFVYSLVNYGLLVLILMTALGIMNVPLTPIITAFGAIGLALSLSVKDSLGNVVGGVFLIFNRPFRTGDYIELKGVAGTVEEVCLTYTVMRTTYNRKIFMPNSDFSKAIITNYSTEPTRFLELTFNVKPSSGIDKAKAIIEAAFDECGLILPDMKPIVRVSDHTDAAVQITCMAKVEADKLFELKAFMIQRVRERFIEDGI